MVRPIISVMRICLLGMFSMYMLSCLTHIELTAREAQNYHIPKGIVLNAGQYPSSVYGYAHIGNSIIWIDHQGLLIDLSSAGQVIRLKYKGERLDIIKGLIIQERNVISKDKESKEYILRDISLMSNDGKSISTFALVESGMQWTLNDLDSEWSIEGADSTFYEEAKSMIHIYAGSMQFVIHTPCAINKAGQLLQTQLSTTTHGTFQFSVNEQKGEQVQGVPILFSTILGGSAAEAINAITLDQKGNIYVLGETDSPDYPVSTGAYTSPNAIPKDIFIAKFDSTGSNIIYSSRIGGDQTELGTSIAVDNLGQVCVAGSTTSKNFPSTSTAFQPNKLFPNEDVFAIKVNAAGNALVYGTFMIGMTTDIAHAITVDEKGDMYLTGATGILSKNPHTFPKTANAYDTTYNGGSYDVFVAKLNPAGKGNQDLQFCTLIGGNEVDIAYKIALAKNGDIIVAGETSSNSLFPISTNSVQNAFNGVSDGFVAILSPKGDSLKYSTLIGGSGYERITGLVFDEQSQNVFFAGYTNSSGIADISDPTPIMFPVTKNAYDTVYNGGIYDGFIGKLDPFSGNALRYASFIGGNGDDYVMGLGVDVCAAPYVTGSTNSLDYPITEDASDTTIKKIEGFITKFNALGNVLVFSSFIGNDDEDQLNGIIVDQSGAIFLGGSVQGSGIPGTNASTNGRDGFIAKIQVGILPLKPSIDKIGNLSFCKGDSVILDASSRNLVSYQWRKNNVIIPNANAAKLTVKTSGMYTVDVADASGCTGTASLTVIAFDRPGLSIAKIPLLCPGDSVQISATTTDSLSLISWSPAIGLSCLDCLNPKASPPMSMNYVLKTIDTNGCLRFDTIRVEVIDSMAISTQSITDTMYLCPNATTSMNIPITNSSILDLHVKIVAFSNPALQSIIDSILVPANATVQIPITFSGVQTIGPQVYSITFSDQCGTLKSAQCIINVQNPKLTYQLDSSSEICRTEIARQVLRISNLNGLKGKISIGSSAIGYSSNQSAIELNPYGTDSIAIQFQGNTAGFIPVTILVNHECGTIDTLTWNIKVISNPYGLSWISDTTIHSLDKPIVKTLELNNLSKQSLPSAQSYEISLMHEYSAMKLDSIVSEHCTIVYTTDRDTIILNMIDCDDSLNVKAHVYFTPLVGETLRPWLKILNFKSKSACIDPILNTPSDTILLDSYGCELTTVKVNRATATLKSVHMNQDQSLLSIRYVILERKSARFHCMNAVGQVVRTMTIQMHEPGEHELSIPLDALPNGIYTLMFEAGNHVESSLFMKME